MKIIIFLNNDIHAAQALRLLETDLKDHQVRIVLSRQVGKTSDLPSELLAMKEKEKFAIEENFSYRCDFYANVNSEEALQDFKNFAPDLMISIRFGQIMKAPLISISRHGVINLHSGILPKYRGVLASFWAILHGEESLGTTLHFINDGTIDTGEIIAFSKTEIDRDVALITNINRLYENGCALISKVLQQIMAGEEVQTINQKSLGAGQYFTYPKNQDVANFLKLMRLY